MCFSSEKTRYGRSALTVYFIKMLYIEITFPHFFSIFADVFPTIYNKMFRVGAKT